MKVFSGGVLPCSMTEPQTAPQSNDEADRRVYIDSLPVSEVAPMMEAVKLWEYSSWHEIRFCVNMAKLYGCRPLEADVDNFNNFLVALYHYGRVQGIRAERAKRNRR